MGSFLEQVAADLHGRYGDGVSSLSMVFPSRRAALFFGEALSSVISRPMWQPVSITVDQVAAELSGLTIGDRLRLITELFKVYREFHPAENFDTFYFWGELLLGDFDSIDKYLVDADTLFSNLVDLHALDDRFDYLSTDQKAAIEKFWGVFTSAEHSGKGFSPEQSDFLNIWRTLAPVYHRFKARLSELGIAYQGMVYREAAERITAGRAPQIPDRHYVVAGFNALSRSEQVMLDYLRREFKVDFYWDRDDYFVNDTHQEAGMFMRDNLRRFPSAAPLVGGHDNFRRPKKIRSVAAASDMLQCKYAGLALADIARRTSRPPGRETAVVLCDESLLSPLLWSMPPEVAGINITMGYPLRMHPAYTFVERLVELQRRRRGRRGTPMFYHSDVEGLVRHPYLISSGAPPPLADNFVYISASRLHTSPIFERIFSAPGGGKESDAPAGSNEDGGNAPRDWQGSAPGSNNGNDHDRDGQGSAPGSNNGNDRDRDWQALSDYLIDILGEVSLLPFDATGEGSATDEGGVAGRRNELFALIVEHIGRLANSLNGCGVELSTKTYTRLLRRTLQSVTLPFEGEPLEGVQVMGILETRALDFENIIFLSAGDDNMPGNLVGAPSFIPYNLKAAYSLPTPEHHEGVYAYHFFRLLGRASRIELVWSRTSDEKSSGAPSRYILQLDYESPHEVAHETVAVDVNLSPSEPIMVAKDAEIMRRLGEFLLADNPRRLSPSLFYAYVECPLKFYFRGVGRLRAEEEISEEVDGALLGSILHRAMQLLYLPLIGIRDPRSRIRALIGSPEVESAVRIAITELHPGEEGAGFEDRGGGIMLAAGSITGYIERCILPYDASLPSAFTIESLEERIETSVAFDGRGGDLKGCSTQTVLFSGIADRIDRLPDGTPRVVDYKTGNPRNNASALLQMGLYAMMLGENGGGMCGNGDVGTRKVEPVLYYVRDMSKPGYSPPPVEQGPEFEENLRGTLIELFDPSIPFTQCPDTKSCEWCDFAPICRR